MITVTRRLEVDAGHRLQRHESKCANVHGHRYVFDITLAGDLDDVGRVLDFGQVKAILGPILDARLDHGFIYEEGDPVGELLNKLGQKTYRMRVPPTAENLAALVLHWATEHLILVRVVSVTCYETPNCSATAVSHL